MKSPGGEELPQGIEPKFQPESGTQFQISRVLHLCNENREKGMKLFQCYGPKKFNFYFFGPLRWNCTELPDVFQTGSQMYQNWLQFWKSVWLYIYLVLWYLSTVVMLEVCTVLTEARGWKWQLHLLSSLLCSTDWVWICGQAISVLRFGPRASDQPDVSMGERQRDTHCSELMHRTAFWSLRWVTVFRMAVGNQRIRKS